MGIDISDIVEYARENIYWILGIMILGFVYGVYIIIKALRGARIS